MGYKLLGGVALATVCDENLLVATRQASEKVPAIKELNETGAFVWRMLEQGDSLAEMTAKTAAEYEISPEEARDGILDFIKVLQSAGYVIEQNNT